MQLQSETDGHRMYISIATRPRPAGLWTHAIGALEYRQLERAGFDVNANQL